MSDDLVKRLRDVAEATGPNEARQVALDAADRIEELEAENKLHAESATIIHFQGVMYARDSMADAIWAEFKDRWEGERKYALRQIVQWLREDRAGQD